MMCTSTRTFSLLAAALLSCACAFAQTASSSEKTNRPDNQIPASLPEDKHEGLSVSVNSYTSPERAKDIFGKANPLVVGILPVEVFLHNETTQAMRMNVS